MKKYLLVLLLIVFIVPSVALASWWNPFSWFNGWTFHKTEVAPPVQTETQKTPDEQIKDLQKQVDDLKKQQPDTTSSETTPPTKEVKKTTPSVKKETKVVDANDKIISKEAINDYIVQLNTLIARYNKELSDSKDFERKIYADMAEYNSSSVKSKGQAILDNDLIYHESMNKLIVIFDKIINKITPYIESDNILRDSDIANLLEETKPYIDQYNSSSNQIEPLIKSFVNAQSSYLDKEASRLKNAINNEIQAQNEARQEQINSATNSTNAKIEYCNSLIGQGRGIPSSIIEGQLRSAGCI